MKETIKKYIENNNQEFQRYNSWNHCYKAFSNLNQESDFLALHLAFYLASWGMYRGSSNLLDKDYKVHVEAVSIIKHFAHLRCDKNNEVSIDNLEDILLLIKNLSVHYEKKHKVTPTDTLISKIILGTLGCAPAFDRFFIQGVKQEKRKFTTLKRRSLNSLFHFIVENEKLMNTLKKTYPQYSTMKLVDMYYWQIGYDRNTLKCNNKSFR